MASQDDSAEAHAAGASEATPLLPAANEDPRLPQGPAVADGAGGRAEAAAGYGTGSSSGGDQRRPPNGSAAGADRGGDDDDDDDAGEKPIPRLQIFLLCYARLVEPVAFFSIFPYVNQMTQQNGQLDEADVGFYSGMIESLFSLTQALVMILWGRAADRYGRKPVLVFSLAGVCCATAVFGLARTVWQMILFRCLAGVFAGTIVTIRTMLAEHSTPRTQARVFSWFAFSGNIGIFLGPLLGGALADPAGQYRGWFARIPFFADYLYALPNVVVACLGVTAAIAVALFGEETLDVRERKKLGGGGGGGGSGEDDEDGGDDGESARAGGGQPDVKPSSSSSPTWDLLRSPGVSIVLYVYSHIMLLAFAYTAIVPLWWYTSVALGGFGFSPRQISLLLCLNGLAQAAWLLLVFPPLQHRIGTNGVLRLCAYAYPVFFALCPFGNMLLRAGAVTAFWAIAPPLLAVGCGISMSFTAIQLALNDVSPSPLVLGTLNALALTGSSVIRAFAPALFTSLFALGANTQWLDGHAIWVLMVLVAAGFSVVSNFMPDYDELRREREGQGPEQEGR